jgi:hypothetical protein
MKRYIFASALLCMALATGCERNDEDDDLARFGERTEDAFENAGERAEEAMERTGDAIEDTAEDASREMQDGSG